MKIKFCSLPRRALVPLLALALACAIVLPQRAAAESTVASGAGALTTAARLDFSIVIPHFLFLRVGSAGAGIDLITFTPPAGNVGDSTVIAGVGGDIGGGVVTVQVRANGGQVVITPTNNSGGAGLSNGAGGNINYNEISTATNTGNVPAPTLSNAGGTAANPVLNAGTITNRAAQWTYTYLNTTVPAVGTYGTSANGGRVTYTATSP